jgi:26S proteasome regulatory subunit T2
MGGEGPPPGGGAGSGGGSGNDPNSSGSGKDGAGDGKKKKKRFEPRPAAGTRQGRRRRRRGPSGLNKVPAVAPSSKCKLRMLKLDRVRDFLLLEEEFIRNHEVFKPSGELRDQEEREKLDELRGSPLGVGSLEELIDDNHAIVSSSVGA